MYDTDDTIAAIASAPAGAARAIVRVSGPGTLAALQACFRPDGGALETLRRATAASGHFLLEPGASSGAALPADVYYWPDERSYTRQPCGEVHTLGSPPLASAVLTALCRAGTRVARPGEFTLRAFLAGRLDLTQAEAVLGVIDARGEGPLRAALVQLAGGLSRPLHALRERLLSLLAELEAGLDFVEEDIEFVGRGQIAAELAAAAALLARTISQLDERRESPRPPRVVLVGRPNVGKSSLFNALTGGRGALVSHVPGTTRDYLSAVVRVGPVEFELVDTAGHESPRSDDAVAWRAQQVAAAQGLQGDIRLLCLDAARAANSWERAELAAGSEGAQLVVVTKCDLPAALETPAGAWGTSAANAWGIEALRGQIARLVAGVRTETAASLSAERSAESLHGAQRAVAAAQELNASGGGEELIAAELRAALGELGKVVGAVYTDDILDLVFSRFCIGK